VRRPVRSTHTIPDQVFFDMDLQQRAELDRHMVVITDLGRVSGKGPLIPNLVGGLSFCLAVTGGEFR
jgi:hypothetical protein